MVIAATKNSEYAGIAHEEKPIFGLLSLGYLYRPVRGDANAGDQAFSFILSLNMFVTLRRYI